MCVERIKDKRKKEKQSKKVELIWSLYGKKATCSIICDTLHIKLLKID